MIPAERGRQDAVSPVVGVMLMLAITVMLAAAASAFAGSFAGSSDKVPQAGFHVRVSLPENLTYFDHAGGDPLSLENTRVVFIDRENKTTISRADIGRTCLNFTQVGSGGTTIKVGDSFAIIGEPYGDHTGIRYGNFSMKEEDEITWMVIDTRTSKTIAIGSFYL